MSRGGGMRRDEEEDMKGGDVAIASHFSSPAD